MSFLEYGVEKKQLTPKLQEYVEMEINLASKENHMNIIAQFYLTILYEFFTVNTGKVNQHERETDSNKSTFNVGDTM